jgi:Ser/Thr protein kinase RdoA (MazF antagonist)
MNAITQLDVLDLEHTIARYGVGDLIRYWPAANGIENSNYFIRTSDRGREREFVLTIMEQPANAGGAYVPLLDLCIEAGLPVAGIVRNQSGEAIDRYDGKLIILSKRLPASIWRPTAGTSRCRIIRARPPGWPIRPRWCGTTCPT